MGFVRRRSGENQTGLIAEEDPVNIGLRAIFLLAAVVVFVISIFVDTNEFKWMAAGLALFAAAFFVSEGGVGGRRRLRL